MLVVNKYARGIKEIHRGVKEDLIGKMPLMLVHDLVCSCFIMSKYVSNNCNQSLRCSKGYVHGFENQFRE